MFFQWTACTCAEGCLPQNCRPAATTRCEMQASFTRGIATADHGGTGCRPCSPQAVEPSHTRYSSSRLQDTARLACTAWTASRSFAHVASSKPDGSFGLAAGDTRHYRSETRCWG